MPTLFQVLNVYKIHPPQMNPHDPTKGTYAVWADVELSCGCGKPPRPPVQIKVRYWDPDRVRGNEGGDPRRQPARAICPNGCSEKVVEAPGITEEMMDNLVDLALAELDVIPGPRKGLLPVWAVGLLFMIVAAVAFFAFRTGCRPAEAEAARSERRAYIRALERARDLPRGLLWKVCKAESRCRMVVRRDGKQADVGPWQVRALDVHTRGGDRFREALQDFYVNAAEAARLLVRSRRQCEAKPNIPACKRCPWGLYNPRSTTWCRKVLGGES